MRPALMSRREAVAWLAAFVVVAAVLVRTGFESSDPDSSLYAALAERLAERPPAEWIVPYWWGLWNGAGLFREHPAGVMVPSAALGAMGVPARQAAYVLGVLYGLAVLLLIGRLVARLTSRAEGRWALVLLQLMPVAFVFRIRANHEYPMLLCLLVALIGVDGVRRSWRWLPVLPLALTAALLIKGVFVMLVLLAVALWILTNPAREPGGWRRPVIACVVGVGLMAITVLAYDSAYERVAGTPFWSPYWQRQLAPLTIATPLDGSAVLADHIIFYVSLIAWHPAPWSVALLLASWRWRGGFAERWRTLTMGERRGLIFALAFAATAILLLSPSSRFAERYAFSATYAVATAGVVVALRGWPWLRAGIDRLDRAIPALPVVVWLTLILLRLAVSAALPRV